jgi:hypothetical protein
MVVGMTIYRVTWPQDSEGGTARAPEGWWPPKMDEREIRAQWSTPTFVLDGSFVDLQPNDAGVKLVSSRMQELIDQHKAAIDRIEWLPVRLQGNVEIREYAIPHLLDQLEDLIDATRTILNPRTGEVVRPHLRLPAIDGHRVFTYSNSTGLIILFTDPVYNALRSCSGCAFSKIPAS